jgi:hypothetical protein
MKKMHLLLLLIVASSLSHAYGQNGEELAIKTLLQRESATWRSGDIKGHAACWLIKPYSRILISTGDGTTLDLPPDLMINPPATMVGQGGSSINTNYKMRVSGNNAWVSHDEESTAKDGSKSYTYEFRILEKSKGKWKLVGQSIHVYKPK